MVGRHQPATFLRVEVERAAGVEEFGQLVAGPPRAPPGDGERAPGRADDGGRLGDRLANRCDRARRFRREPLVKHQARRHRLAQDVGGGLQVRGSRFAVVAGRGGDRRVKLAHDLFGDARGPGVPGHGRQDGGVGNVLKGRHVRLRARGAATDQQHRDAGKVDIGHPGHAVGHPPGRPWPGRRPVRRSVRHARAPCAPPPLRPERPRSESPAGRSSPRSAGCGPPGGRTPGSPPGVAGRARPTRLRSADRC